MDYTKTYMCIAYNEDGLACGVRITGLGEDFVVALHDVKKEVTWDEACKLKAPTKKQATLMIAVWDELNAMLQEAGGDSLCNDDNWRWTSTTHFDNRAWLYYGTYGKLSHNIKCLRYMVRPVSTIK